MIAHDDNFATFVIINGEKYIIVDEQLVKAPSEES